MAMCHISNKIPFHKLQFAKDRMSKKWTVRPQDQIAFVSIKKKTLYYDDIGSASTSFSPLFVRGLFYRITKRRHGGGSNGQFSAFLRLIARGVCRFHSWEWVPPKTQTAAPCLKLKTLEMVLDAFPPCAYLHLFNRLLNWPECWNHAPHTAPAVYLLFDRRTQVNNDNAFC